MIRIYHQCNRFIQNWKAYSSISGEDYNHAQKVCNVFEIINLGEYMELHLHIDVLLLEDMSENFRDICMKAYGLDPVHYYRSSGLMWDAMRKMTDIHLQLLTDPYMLLLFEHIRLTMTRQSRKCFSCILTHVIYTGGPWVNRCLWLVFGGCWSWKYVYWTLTPFQQTDFMGTCWKLIKTTSKIYTINIKTCLSVLNISPCQDQYSIS